MKKGDKIVAIKDHSQLIFKKGDIFICDGFACCPNCGEECVYLDVKNNTCNSICSGCSYLENNVRENYKKTSFEVMKENTKLLTTQELNLVDKLGEVYKEFKRIYTDEQEIKNFDLHISSAQNMILSRLATREHKLINL